MPFSGRGTVHRPVRATCPVCRSREYRADPRSAARAWSSCRPPPVPTPRGVGWLD